jgi:hypothetical protein
MGRGGGSVDDLHGRRDVRTSAGRSAGQGSLGSASDLMSRRLACLCDGEDDEQLSECEAQR